MFDLPGGVPASFHLVMALMSSDVSMSALSADQQAGITQIQRDLVPGSVGFLMRTDSVVDHGLQVIKVRDPEESPWSDIFEDYQDRLDRNYVMVQWHATDDVEGDVGWVHRSKIVPLKGSSEFDRILEKMRQDGDDLKTSELPFMDRAYRVNMAEVCKVDNDGSQPPTCGSCRSVQVVVRIWHDTYLSASALWRPDKDHGNKLRLFQSSIDEKNCEFRAKLVCLDCEWEREVNAKEFAGRLGHTHGEEESSPFDVLGADSESSVETEDEDETDPDTPKAKPTPGLRQGPPPGPAFAKRCIHGNLVWVGNECTACEVSDEGYLFDEDDEE